MWLEGRREVCGRRESFARTGKQPASGCQDEALNPVGSSGAAPPTPPFSVPENTLWEAVVYEDFVYRIYDSIYDMVIPIDRINVSEELHAH